MKYTVQLLIILSVFTTFSKDITQKKVYSTVSIYPISASLITPNLSYDIVFKQKHGISVGYFYSFRENTPGHYAIGSYSYFFTPSRIIGPVSDDNIGNRYHGIGLFLRASDMESKKLEYNEDPYKYHAKETYLTPGFLYTHKRLYKKGFTLALELGYGFPIEVFKGFRWDKNIKPAKDNEETTEKQSKVLTGLEAGIKVGYSF